MAMSNAQYEFENIVINEEHIEFDVSLRGECFHCILTGHALSEAVAADYVISKKEAFRRAAPRLRETILHLSETMMAGPLIITQADIASPGHR
jgi:hypothetical protein